MIEDIYFIHSKRQARKDRAMATTISGAVTEAKLEAWINKYRPDLAIRDEQGVKGFYRVNIGPAHSFQSCGPTWRDVAARLGAVDVSDER